MAVEENESATFIVFVIVRSIRTVTRNEFTVFISGNVHRGGKWGNKFSPEYTSVVQISSP